MANEPKTSRTRALKVFSVTDAVRKSAAEVLVLHLLAENEMYTYELSQIIKERSKGVLVFSTLYQAIYRLKDLGYVIESRKDITEDNRTRVYFAITDKGKEVLPKMIDEYSTVCNAINGILFAEGGKEDE
jgi:PadR family transcriptional regulator PadR